MSASSGSRKLPLAVSLGEPGGIGLQLLLALRAELRAALPPVVLFAPPQLARRRAAHWGIRLDIVEVGSCAEAAAASAEGLPVFPIQARAAETRPGEVAADKAVAAESLTRAVAAAAEGSASGLVTLPLAKKSLPAAFRGQTEFCAAASKTSAAMMLLNHRLRAVPATTHIPLAAVARALSKRLLVEKGLITLEALRRDFALPKPRLAVAGLNPHAGEGGLLGDEERRLIAPAVAELRAKTNCEIIGPLPADSMFTTAGCEKYDAALCMYHDQALIAVKSGGGFVSAVNATLGLRFVRTSPAHGTALDAAAKRLGDYTSLKAALLLAAVIVDRRRGATHA